MPRPISIREFVHNRLHTATMRAAKAQGYQLVPRHYYSPIPFDTPRAEWDRRSPMAGIAFDLDAQIEWLELVTANAAGWTAPDSPMYGPVDAELLYGAMKELDPSRVVELGSGTSSAIIRQALDRPHDIYDPVPNDRTTLNVHRVSAVDVPLAVFRALRAGDVLFVDTTHTVKTGGDVNRIVLDFLPELAEGVVVHIHDIFLPYEYPHEWAVEGRLWAEQYLVQAFLIDNPRWRVLCGANAVAQEFPERVEAAIPRFKPGLRPGALWIQRV